VSIGWRAGGHVVGIVPLTDGRWLATLGRASRVAAIVGQDRGLAWYNHSTERPPPDWEAAYDIMGLDCLPCSAQTP